MTISDGEILRLLRTGYYYVDLQTAQVTRYDGKVLAWSVSESGYTYIKIGFRKRQRTISLSHLVWMAEHSRVLHEGYEVHHLDGDRRNNCHTNLIAVSRNDHAKIHQHDQTPF